MQKLITLERPDYQPMYRTHQASDVVHMCSPYTSRFALLRDAPSETDSAWESFDENSLTTYFSHGLNALHRNVGRLQDLLQPYTEADQKNLLFMTESLIQARRLIGEVQVPSE